MAFNSKWSASEISRAVRAALGKDYNGSPELVESGGASVDGEPLVLNKYIRNAINLILYPATDIQNHKTAEISIRTALSYFQKKDFIDINKLIIPVSEQQKILGRPRNHWVTLTYDFTKHTATIIDSRPRILSFLYPTKHMTTMLKEGLTQAGVDTSEFKVKHIYQNVQHNDVRCGAWTSTNILKQCGHEEYAELDIKKIDEIDMVNTHIERAGSNTEKTNLVEKPKGFFKWLMSWFIASKPEQVVSAARDQINIPSSTSTVFKGLGQEEGVPERETKNLRPSAIDDSTLSQKFEASQEPELADDELSGFEDVEPIEHSPRNERR